MRGKALVVNFTKRYAFLEIPKNASTSLKAFFQEDERVIDRSSEDVEVRDYEPAGVQIAYLRMLLDGHRVARDGVYAIIRNPFSRALSQYDYARRHNQLQSHLRTFRDYVLHAEFSMQCDFVRDPKTGDALVPPSNLLRFEHLRADFQDRFLRRYYPDSSSSSSLPYRNVSAYGKNIEALFDDETIAKILDTYTDEFEFFGFDTEPRFRRVSA